MEGKTVILSVLIMSLVLAQIQVEAKVCCRSRNARNCYTICRRRLPGPVCALRCGCIIISRNTCPRRFPFDNLDNSGDGVNEYCKLGCTSSVCGPMTTLQNSDASEIVDGAVDQCANECSTFCTQGSKLAVETA